MSILDDVYENVVNAKRYDDYIMMCCLWHEDRHPSLMVHEDFYKCLSCGAFGMTERLLLQLGSRFVIPKEDNVEVKNPFWKWLRGDDLSSFLKNSYQVLKTYPQQGKYLEDRGLTKDTIQKAKIGYSDGFYLIPILNTHQHPVGALARAGSSIEGARYFVPPGQTDLLYSPDWQMVKDAKEVYLTFGTLDALSIFQLGKAAISTTSGKRVKPEWFSEIRKRIKVFPDFGEEKEAKKLVSELGWRGEVVKYQYPFGMKDPNDLLRHGLLAGVL